MPTILKLARLVGGVTYQPQFTFKDRRHAIADTLQSELLKSSPSRIWKPEGFEITLADRDKIRVSHLKHAGWYATVSEHDIYWQYDYPSAEHTDETLRVQTELFARLSQALQTGPIRSIGIKFIAFERLDEEALSQALPKLIAVPVPVLSEGSAEPLDVAMRVSYAFLDGKASVSLQATVDAENSTFMLDLDFACRDPFGIPADHLDFYQQGQTHYESVKETLAAQVLQLPMIKRDKELEMNHVDE